MLFDHLQKTHEFLRVLELFENSSRSIFLTGRAGSGKSTLLDYFRSTTKKNVVVLAPTGVAADNVRGQTIHSFFRFRPDITPDAVKDIRLRRAQREIYKNVDVIIIDEISMVRADILDCIDAFLKLHAGKHDEPFGGIRIIMIGDLFQLPPVVTRTESGIFQTLYQGPYFFHAHVFKDLDCEFLELEMIWRQKEDAFISLLNAVREDRLSEDDLTAINKRYDPSFEPSGEDLYVYLTTTNSLADGINTSRLAALKGKEYSFPGVITGEFEERNLPTRHDLRIKFAAQVMLLNNDPLGRWVNGSLGQITDIIHGEQGDAIRVRLSQGASVDVLPYTWEVFRYTYDKEANRLDSETVGTFTQYPLRLAWAVTIHKAQGKTFSRVIIDVGQGTFSHGQLYVALSRCTALDGIVLKRPVLRRHVLLDERVGIFLRNMKNMVHKTQHVLE
jgi:ATP-dependent exoDNAse (exonuclease V) alpha subunit